MATFNTFSLLPIVLACFVLLVQTGISSHVQLSNDPPPHAPTQSLWFEKHLKNWATKLYQRVVMRFSLVYFLVIKQLVMNVVLTL